MEIVLLEDVKALGKKRRIIKVNEGYARNFILPKKLGAETTPKSLNDLKLQEANADEIAAEQLATAEELGGKLEKSSVALSIKAGENDRAFGPVSSKEIGKAVTEQLGLGIDKRELVLPRPLGTLGTREVPMKLHKDATAKLAVKVVEV